MLAQDIAALVSMPRLLRELGFRVNERSHRCNCLLHGGKNAQAFSWREDGRWFCFSCCCGGDKFTLIEETRQCDFKTALAFLAALAGVSLTDDPKLRADLARARHERRQREFEQARLRAAERRTFLAVRNNVLGLEQLRRNASRRLTDLAGLGLEKFPGEEEAAWAALALVADQIPRAAAAFTVIGFADQETRFRFALNVEQRAAMVDTCLELGGVYTDKGHFLAVVL